MNEKMSQLNGNGFVRICMTPSKNESWIIKPFIAAAKTWAHQVIVADQGSTDGTREFLKSAPGVDLVLNDSPVFDEKHRQELLINRARTIPGRRILIALDADEALSANSLQSKEWEKIENAKPGTVLRFKWVNLLPGYKEAWLPANGLLCGVVDDGGKHHGWRIHSPRVPVAPDAPTLDLEEIVVLHFQYVVWERMRRKHRWYQAWEYCEGKGHKPLDIYRQYNHMYGSWEKSEIQPVRPEWLEGYNRAGIDYQSLACEPVTWWDREVVNMLCEHGSRQFRKLAIWDRDWNKVADQLGIRHSDLRDPRSFGEKTAHRLLAATQEHRVNWAVRAFERLLRARGW